MTELDKHTRDKLRFSNTHRQTRLRQEKRANYEGKMISIRKRQKEKREAEHSFIPNENGI